MPSRRSVRQTAAGVERAATPMPSEPDHDCALCPRLCAFRTVNRRREPTWFNAPVASFGSASARLLIVGLAPGLQGANRTGRPFTGDYAGLLLYETLARYRFARGSYGAHPDDGLELLDCRITNAVRCVPPENKPTTAEIATCRNFLQATIAEMPKLKALVALGKIAHDSVVTTFGAKKSRTPFKHGGKNMLGEFALFSSYHCSRYNTNTGVLTPEMFRSVFAKARSYLDA
jgi:uracil-DNA glycosylase family 4